MTLRVAFFGTPSVAVAALEALHAAHDLCVDVVVTNPDRPRGRGRQPARPPVAVTADSLGLEVIQPHKVGDIADDLTRRSLDVAGVVAYGQLLPAPVLATTRLGFVNLHFSVLPRWRGAAPVQHALRAGDTVTGATTFVLDEGMDTGPVLEVLTTPIAPDDDAGTLLERLSVQGAGLLVSSLRQLAAGTQPTPQSNTGVTHAPKLQPDDARIDWQQPALTISWLVRSVTPSPGAFTELEGQRVKLFGVKPQDCDGADLALGAAPGTILALRDTAAVVASGQGSVIVAEMQMAGRRRMTAVEVANGIGGLVGKRFT